eukprot:Rhum_TRINITY_DN9874_c0_g1::Rhum_TRINITY_DN9874_c0_g1_i1::g.35652::m.35652
MAVSVQPPPCAGAVCAMSSLLSDATPPSPDAGDAAAAACAFRRRLSTAREAVEDGLWPCDVEEGVRVAAALCREECYAHSDTRVASDAAQLLCAVALRMHESAGRGSAVADEDTAAAVAGTLHQTAHLLHVLSRHYCSRVRRTALTCALRCAQHTRLPAKHLLTVLNAALPRLHDPEAGVREASLRCLLCASERLGRLSRERLGTAVHDELLARLMFVVRDADVGVRLRGAQLLSTCVHASEAQLLSCLAQEDLAPEAAAAAAAASGGLDSVGLMMLGLEDDNAGVRQAVLTSMCRLGLSAEQPHFAETAVTFVVDACFDESPGVRMEALRCVGEWGRSCILDEGQVRTVLDCLIADEPGVLRAVLAVLGRLRFTDQGTLLSCVESLLAILSTDTMGPVFSSVWQALARLGATHPSVSELLPAVVPASGMIGGGVGGGDSDRAWSNLTSAARTGILKLFGGSPVALAALPSDSPLFLSLAQTNPEAVYELLGCGGDGPAAKRRRLCVEGASTLATLGTLAGAARVTCHAPAAAVAAAAASAAKAAAGLRGPLWLCEAASAVAAWVARKGERQAAAAASAALVRVLLCVAPLPPKVVDWVEEMLERVSGNDVAAGVAAAAAATIHDELPAGWGVHETSAGMVVRPVHEWRRWNASAYVVRGRVQSARAHAPPAVRVRAAGSEQQVSCRLLSASPTSAHQWEMSWRVDVSHAGSQAGDSLVLVAVVPNTLTASPAEVCVSRTPAVVPKV